MMTWAPAGMARPEPIDMILPFSNRMTWYLALAPCEGYQDKHELVAHDHNDLVLGAGAMRGIDDGPCADRHHLRRKRRCEQQHQQGKWVFHRSISAVDVSQPPLCPIAATVTTLP